MHCVYVLDKNKKEVKKFTKCFSEPNDAEMYFSKVWFDEKIAGKYRSVIIFKNGRVMKHGEFEFLKGKREGL